MGMNSWYQQEQTREDRAGFSCVQEGAERKPLDRTAFGEQRLEDKNGDEDIFLEFVSKAAHGQSKIAELIPYSLTRC